MDGDIPTRKDEMAEEAFTSIFPHGLPRAKPVAGSAILRSFPLTAEHGQALIQQVESGEKLGVAPDPRSRMSRRHHRAAQLLANGMSPGRVAVLCRMGAATISILQSDPLFIELLEYYSQQVDEAYRTVVEEMADLNLDVLEELGVRLENNPTSFTNGQLTELMKALSDRTGNGPTSKSESVVTSVALSAADLLRIKSANASAARSVTIDGTARSVGPQAPQRDQSEGGLPHLPTVRNAPTLGPAGEWEGEGDGLGAEGGQPLDETVALDEVAIPRLD